MRILLIGSGGREHALAWKIKQSPRCEALYVAPGNAGTGDDNVVLDVNDHAAVINFCHLMRISLVVIGPEVPLVAGLADDLRAKGIHVFGPSKYAAQLEGSKAFTKAVCDEANIPTAAYKRCVNLLEAMDYLHQTGAPIVLKADGLAAGKGVIVAMTMPEAEVGLAFMFEGKGAVVVMEEFLEGEEASFFVLTDGVNACAFGTAQDHKRAYDGDTGPNTGGMGAYSPANIMTDAVIARTMTEIINPSLKVMRDRGHPYQGVLFAGLMLTKTGPKLIEYNARFGDPECQVLMMRLESDLLPLLEAVAKGNISQINPVWSDDFALTVVYAAKGYPGEVKKGSVITIPKLSDAYVFHAGTKRVNGAITANGGRVLAVTAKGKTAKEAQRLAYKALDAILWDDGFARRDIAWREVAREGTVQESLF
jgi:phosphoribosylamine---glycine ligase